MNENFLKLANITYNFFEYLAESDLAGIAGKERTLEMMQDFVLMLDDNDAKSRFFKNIDIVLGLLKLAKDRNRINATNYLIICNEYRKIKERTDSTQISPSSVLVKLESQISLSDRQKKIIGFLGEKEKAQVMDLQDVLPTVTKRTIRRDLDELMASGQIVRIGEFNKIFYCLSK